MPGACDAWMLMLRDYGTLTVRDVLEPAIFYAEHGHPLLPRVAETIAEMADFFRDEWPTSAAAWLPGGVVPAAGSLFRNPVLAETWKQVIREAEGAGSREAGIERARDAFYRGFIAEASEGFFRTTEVMDASDSRHKGVLTGEDRKSTRLNSSP